MSKHNQPPKHPVNLLIVDVTESVSIEAPQELIWEAMQDFEGNWEESNPEHDGTRILSELKTPLRNGLQFWQRESIGPVVGELDGTILDVDPPHTFSWRAKTTYRILLFRVEVVEGGTVTLVSEGEKTKTSHRVWCRYPEKRFQRFPMVTYDRVFNGTKAAAKHTRVELEYFKDMLESGSSE